MSMMRSTVGGVRRTRNQFAQIVALAAVMLGVGVVPSQATSITHQFSSGSLVQDYNFSPILDEDTLEITGYLYTFRVGFESVLDSFNLTITNQLINFPGPDADGFFGVDGFKCAQITTSGKCVDFVASTPDAGGIAALNAKFADGVTVGLRFAPFGWPLAGPDPIEIGITDNFSSFMLYASQAPDPVPPGFDDTYRFVHFATNASAPSPVFKPITHLAHCGGSDIDACARANNLAYFAVPEPATVGGVVWGLLGLTVLGRRLKRRD